VAHWRWPHWSLRRRHRRPRPAAPAEPAAPAARPPAPPRSPAAAGSPPGLPRSHPPPLLTAASCLPGSRVCCRALRVRLELRQCARRWPLPHVGNTIIFLGSEGAAPQRTRRKLADSVQQLELPALFYVVECLRNLVRRRLNVELQPEAVHVVLACRVRAASAAVRRLCDRAQRMQRRVKPNAGAGCPLWGLLEVLCGALFAQAGPARVQGQQSSARISLHWLAYPVSRHRTDRRARPMPR